MSTRSVIARATGEGNVLAKPKSTDPTADFAKEIARLIESGKAPYSDVQFTGMAYRAAARATPE
jgi:hypothetical protein